MTPSKLHQLFSKLWPYVQIARIDHWFKNAFMILGVLLAVFYRPETFAIASLWPLALAVFATCLIASSNYVINEYLDAPNDRKHPVKCRRPAAAGKISRTGAIVQWLGLGAIGMGLAFSINFWFGLSGAWLWVMGFFYNVKPFRTKELPYLDVLSESVNNPIRLLLGWFALVPDALPPLSLALSYWMVGAFFMALKRFAEYRSIGDPKVAAEYRGSFAHYNEDRLLVSIFFYVSACALFAGVFMVRYHFELILFVPLAAGFLAYYMKLGLLKDSPVQNPEKLYAQKGFFLYTMACFAVFVGLMFVHIPGLYDCLNVKPASAPVLWTFGTIK